MIIGLSGKIGTGKTLMAQHLMRQALDLKIPCKRIAFGDILKQEASRIFGFNLLWAYTAPGKNAVVPVPKAWRRYIRPASLLTLLTLGRRATVRTILQWYGTEWVRRRHPGYWVQAMRQRAEKEISSGVVVVIDDVRFPDEKALVSEMGGLNIRLTPWDGWRPGKNAAHASETALDGESSWDLILNGPRYDDVPRLAGIVLRMACNKGAKAHGLDLPYPSLSLSPSCGFVDLGDTSGLEVAGLDA